MESSQLSFQEVDGELVIIFNEAEALADENADELTEEVIQKRSKSGKANVPRICPDFQKRLSTTISAKMNLEHYILTKNGINCLMKYTTDTAYVILIPNTTCFAQRGITYEDSYHRRSWVYWE